LNFGEQESLLSAPGLKASGLLPPPERGISTEATGCFTPNGRFVALVANGHAQLYDFEQADRFPPVKLRRPLDNVFVISPDGHWLASSRHNEMGPDLYDLRVGRWLKCLEEAGQTGLSWQPHSGQFLTPDSRGVTFWKPGEWKAVQRLEWPEPSMAWGVRAFTADGRTMWANGSGGRQQLFDLKLLQPYAVLEQPVSLSGWDVCFDVSGERAFMPLPAGIALWNLTALRRVLNRLGLDWTDASPGTGFAPRD
jgi:hypothetical protein